ncbi:hypothetical protein PYW07_014716 [Mythimna separata]|uniref:Uncharacterized protein n=1 Tax=Mythimna separata TaxID=271217 RepID=A0AAD7Z2F9_MYTSE|nr:hypothetical protein PYW07_014716 [Mythimna separata]
MRQYVVPVLLLAIVALSASNVLPMSENDFNREQLSFDSQHNDNTFSDRYETRNAIDEIYKLYVAHENKPGSNKLQLKIYTDADNNQNDDIFNIISKDDNYNGEGFRKEQWHNYPRQLDRLHQLYEHNTDKRNFDPDPNKEYTEEVLPDNQDINDKANEVYLDSNPGTDNVYDAVMAATNPLLILKMRLATLNKDIDNANARYANLINSGLGSNNLREDEKNEFRNENPEMSAMKVKREGVASTQNELTENPTQNKAVNKRIFSLWSRLQSLNHKGHELQHRRHLHAFYGLPDSDGGGTLTAETRATLMRPPGSPLRWG